MHFKGSQALNNFREWDEAAGAGEMAFKEANLTFSLDEQENYSPEYWLILNFFKLRE